MIRSLKGKLLLAGLLAGLAGGAYWYWRGQGEGAPAERYRTAPADRGEIVPAVSANGTLSPVVLVNVGTQVSGTLKALHADFNDRVRPGQVLAELDPALFNAAVAQAEANLANARAGLQLAESRLGRSRDLLARGFVSRADLDAAVQARDSAAAQRALAEAQLARERTNLRYSVIRSPVAGVVVARNVDVGQTVAASFQTPTLFQIAGDLKAMQIDTSVAEADVGHIRVGMPVSFGVDAFPEREFAGVVKQVRLSPIIQQNVVTYNVVVGVDNPDERLLPGMTAHIRVVVNRRDAVLRVPNAALRFRPATDEGDADEAKGRRGRKPAGATVYRLENGKPVAVSVETGAADHAHTEITGGELRSGDALVVREAGRKGPDTSRFRMRLF